jgi:hypothetical protein
MINTQQDFKFYIQILGGERQGKHIELSLWEKASEGPAVWIHEDEEICFKLVAPYHTERPILWISDLPKPPSDSRRLNNRMLYIWHPESRGANRYQAFFLNCFGSCQLDIEIKKKGGEQQWIEFAPFEIKARKITAERLREIIQYLALHSYDLADACFSVTQVEMMQNRRKVSGFLKEVEEGLSLFEQQLPILLARHCTRLVPRRVVHQPGPADYFEANTAEWLISHPDILVPAGDMSDAVAVIDSRPYTVNKLEVNELAENSDVYENQILHSYLNSIKTFLAETRKECDRIESSAPASKGSEENEDTDRYVSFSAEIKTSLRELFKARKEKCDILLEKCDYLVRILNLRIPASRFLAGIPSLTPWIKANLHYRILVEKIINWYQMGRADWSDEKALVGVRSIDELYEYFCLYKLVDAMEKLGFRRSNAFPAAETYSSMTQQDGVPDSVYRFERGRISMTLYYEKEIRSPRHKDARDDLYFNVEGWIWDMYRKKGKRTRFNSKRVPDYILEISANGSHSGNRRLPERVLAVFDAKYSAADTVFFEKLPMLVMRYVHGISGREGGISPVISLYLLHPKDTEQEIPVEPVRSFYTDEYDLFGDKAVIPALGAAEVDPASVWDISNLVKRIIELAERRLGLSR